MQNRQPVMCKRILMRVRLDSAGHPQCFQYTEGRCLVQGDRCMLEARIEPDRRSGKQKILG